MEYRVTNPASNGGLVQAGKGVHTAHAKGEYNLMNEIHNLPDFVAVESSLEVGNRPAGIITRIYRLLAHEKLALALLIAILSSCIIGATLFRGRQAGELIFSTLWFNGLLALLVVNVACCFFGRILGRKLTLISAGMILFHLSFVSMFAGIIYNSLFHFHGVIRLTEGETLPSGQPQSYDRIDQGRFFDYARLKGQTTLVRMQTGYKVDGLDKRVAYEIAVGEEGSKKQGLVYITKNLAYDGFRYFNDKEGYSILVVLHDKQGRELFGAYVPLQSLKQKDESYLYTTGRENGPGTLLFPQDRAKPLFNLQVAYRPDPNQERAGDVFFQARPLGKSDAPPAGSAIEKSKTAVGEKFDLGEYFLSPKEVRYWVGMSVRHDPGLPIVLASLWVGLGGMVITTFGRLMKRRRDDNESCEQ